jgi:hypothetical protein
MKIYTWAFKSNNRKVYISVGASNVRAARNKAIREINQSDLDKEFIDKFAHHILYQNYESVMRVCEFVDITERPE